MIKHATPDLPSPELRAEIDLVKRARNRNVPYGWLELADKMAAEIERLEELLRGTGANRYWEGRWRDEVARIERLEAALAIGIEALEWYEQQQTSNWDLGQKASLMLKAALARKEGT